MTAVPPSTPEPSPSRVFAPPTGLYNDPLPPTPPPPPPRKSPPWLLIGGGVAILLICCVGVGLVGVLFSGVLGARLFGGVASDVRGAQNRDNHYLCAIADHDWIRAYGYLDRRTQANTTTATIQRSWTARESANGRVGTFSANNTSVSTNNGKTTATVSGTLRYGNGVTETKTLQLIKEGGDWKLSSLP